MQVNTNQQPWPGGGKATQTHPSVTTVRAAPLSLNHQPAGTASAAPGTGSPEIAAASSSFTNTTSLHASKRSSRVRVRHWHDRAHVQAEMQSLELGCRNLEPTSQIERPRQRH